mmetsp:Transcript_9863/g.34059  ORF Transcript_9863/g.34059 Transcript_9863/m.34059 type:complete len:244 (-) Transcript_9863:258-989(-)
MREPAAMRGRNSRASPCIASSPSSSCVLSRPRAARRAAVARSSCVDHGYLATSDWDTQPHDAAAPPGGAAKDSPVVAKRSTTTGRTQPFAVESSKAPFAKRQTRRGSPSRRTSGCSRSAAPSQTARSQRLRRAARRCRADSPTRPSPASTSAAAALRPLSPCLSSPSTTCAEKPAEWRALAERSLPWEIAAAFVRPQMSHAAVRALFSRAHTGHAQGARPSLRKTTSWSVSSRSGCVSSVLGM